MKAILIVDLDDSFMPLDEDTITLEKGTIKYRDINRNPFAITVEGLKLKPMPQKLAENFGNNTPTNTYITNGTERQYLDMFAVGYNRCIDEILGEQE